MHDWVQIGFWPNDWPVQKGMNIWRCNNCGRKEQQDERPSPNISFSYPLDWRAGTAILLTCEEAVIRKVMES